MIPIFDAPGLSTGALQRWQSQQLCQMDKYAFIQLIFNNILKYFGYFLLQRK